MSDLEKELLSFPYIYGSIPKPETIYYGKYCYNGEYFMTYEELVCDANNLYKAYKASIKGSKWKETIQRFMLNFLPYLFDIQDDLLNRTLKNGQVTEFMMSERGKMRPITSIPLPDRIIRHVLCDDVLMPEVKRHIIYDNGASIKGRGISFQRKRFEIHLHKFYEKHGLDGWILFGDFSKFYDNIIHEIAKRELLKLVDDDEFVAWLLDIIFEGFEIDVSYMSDDEYSACLETTFNKLEYRNIPEDLKTGEKWMKKSVNIGDQLSQVIGIYYPNRIDTYIKYVRSQKYYGRYMDDFYLISQSKDELLDLLENIRKIAKELGIHINEKKTRIVRFDHVFTFLQVKYKVMPDGRISKRLTPRKVTAMRRKLKRLALKVESGELPYESIEEMFRSWMGSFHKILTKDQRLGLITLFETLFHKRILIQNGRMEFNDDS